MVDKQNEDENAVPMGDRGNLGQKAQQTIKEKYKVAAADAIAEEEDLDEYGQELAFDDESD